MNAVQQLVYLTVFYAGWKGLLLVLVSLAPGIGYDTSTTLLPSSSKLVRWDAIYYVQTAHRGQLFEQEWAFGKGLSTLLSVWDNEKLDSIILTGTILAHISHYLCVLLIWQVATLYNGQRDAKKDLTPFIAACLHIISPAGVFLSAPYSESPFACLNMLGFWLYLRANIPQVSIFGRSLMIMGSGMVFGCATAIRSNGLLSGLPFLIDAIILSKGIMTRLIQFKDFSSLMEQLSPLIHHLSAVIVGGVYVAMGILLPQHLAYRDFCLLEGSVRPWCEQNFPLIYSFVQSHYW